MIMGFTPCCHSRNFSIHNFEYNTTVFFPSAGIYLYIQFKIFGDLIYHKIMGCSQRAGGGGGGGG